jgi:ligand-binding SRPBCC domain-containing protein
MTIIYLQTTINAPINICFDVARSIDFHQLSTLSTNEKAIAGVTKGLIGLNEFVTWEATHFGIKQRLTSGITAFEPPYYFKDEQLKGAFKFFKHEHTFKQNNHEVIMYDKFEFASPLGIIGKVFDALVLKKYLKQFLIERNRLIKEFAEGEGWKVFLKYN